MVEICMWETSIMDNLNYKNPCKGTKNVELEI